MKSSLPKSDSTSSPRGVTPKRARAKRGTRARSTNRSSADRQEIAALNTHPLNQHALALLPKWAIKPDYHQMHLLTLAAPAKFASKPDAATLQKMRGEWAPADVLDYFTRVATFEDLFLTQHEPLEAVHVILAAVDIIAEPHQYLPAFRLE